MDKTVTSNLDLNNNKIINLSDGTNNKDVVTLEQLNKSHVKNSHPASNVFQYIMADVNEISEEYSIEIIEINEYQNSPHTIARVSTAIMKRYGESASPCLTPRLSEK